jgi:hypothetical protein
VPLAINLPLLKKSSTDKAQIKQAVIFAADGLVVQ